MSYKQSHPQLGDLTTSIRVIPISLLAIAIGAVCAFVALDDLLKARSRHLEEEQRRDRPLKLKFLLPGSDTKEPAEVPVIG